MYEKLLETVMNLGSPSVLVVGDYMLDVYIYGDADRISPEAPVPVLKVRNTTSSCGGAASVVNDLAVLGAKPICLGMIGDDADGRTLQTLLNQAGADTNGLLKVTDRPTISKQRLIGLAQHRHQQQLFRMDHECTDPMTYQQKATFLELYKQAILKADVICLQDYNKGLLSPDLCQQMISVARDAGKKVLVDPALNCNYTKYSGATLITPNRTEASAAAGIDIKTAGDASSAALTLRQKLNLDSVVITLDKEGAYLLSDTIDELIPTRPRTVYDVTGAGDMVLATLALAHAAGCDDKTAVQIANIAGGIEVGKFGVATVTIEEILAEILTENHISSGKLRSPEQLVRELDLYRRRGKKIIFTNGCFDVLHRGHTEYLSFCKQHGDILVVGLNSDTSVKIIKGPERPINDQDDRQAVLSALDTVDYIAIFDEPDPLNLIKTVKPDVLVKGEDWADKGVIGSDFVTSYGGTLVYAPFVKGRSSTKTIEKMRKLNGQD